MTYKVPFVDAKEHYRRYRHEFEPAIQLLKDGIARNSEIEPMNRDMSMLIDAMRPLPPEIDAAMPPALSGAAVLADERVRRADLAGGNHRVVHRLLLLGDEIV